MRAHGINTETALSALLLKYVQQNQKDPPKEEPQQPTVQNVDDPADDDQQPVLVNGKEDFEALGNMMELLAVKIEKKKQKQGRSVKAQKAFKEWKTDYIRANDEEMMILMAEQLTKLRLDDKLGFKKNVKA